MDFLAAARRHHHEGAGREGSRSYRGKDEKWGERPAAIVVRDYQAEEAPTENTIRAHVGRYADEGAISKYGVPQTILFVDQIERTSVGKIDKKALRKRYAEDE